MSKKKKKSQPVMPKTQKTNIIGTIKKKDIIAMKNSGFIEIRGTGIHGDVKYNRKKNKKELKKEVQNYQGSKDSYFFIENFL